MTTSWWCINRDVYQHSNPPSHLPIPFYSLHSRCPEVGQCIVISFNPTSHLPKSLVMSNHVRKHQYNRWNCDLFTIPSISEYAYQNLCKTLSHMMNDLSLFIQYYISSGCQYLMMAPLVMVRFPKTQVEGGRETQLISMASFIQGFYLFLIGHVLTQAQW